MKTVRTATAWLAIGFLVTLPARADVGRIPASYGVSSLGGFTYAIPIPLPPGPRGLTPQLVLVYNSTMDSNTADEAPLAGTSSIDEIPAGAGWTLQGLSLIQRTDKTVAQDGAVSAPAYSATDAYDIDGQRLRLTSSGNYGEAGSTFQTELADFSQVTADGTTSYGPAYWTAQLKNGLTYEYGNTTDSKILMPSAATGMIREWLLDKVSDVNGNKYTITYGTGAADSVGIGVPVSMSWTLSASGSTSYNYTIAFSYSERQPDEAITGYAQNGKLVENNNLLHTITVSYEGTVVRYYQLNYTTSAVTGRSLLSSVDECSDSTMSVCFGPTSFAYAQTPVSVSSTSGSLTAGAVLGDFNQDGRSDMLSSSGGTLYVAFGDGTGGFSSAVSTGIAPSGPYFVGDFLHQGKDGILSDHSGTWWYYTWNGSGFTGASTGLSVESTATYSVADIDGDGLPDLISTHVVPYTGPGTGNTVAVYANQNTSSNGQLTFSSTEYNIYNYAPGAGLEIQNGSVWGSGDASGSQGFHFTGNTQEGLLMTVSYNGGTEGLFELLSNGLSTVMTAEELSASYTAGEPVVALNWNADECTDVAWGESILVNSCNGPFVTYTVGYPIIGAISLNGDSAPDLLVNMSGKIGYYPSTGSAVGSSPINTNVAVAGAAFPLSVTGDGLPDVGTGSTYYLHTAAATAPDLLTSVTDGDGNNLQPEYSSITSGPYTLGSGAASPESDWIGDLWVVTSLSLPNGIGGSYQRTYKYSDARTSILRGFEGFSKIEVTDSRDSQTETTSYDLLFPLTGLVTEDDIAQGSGTPISQTSYSTTEETLNSAQYNERYFPYASNVTSKTYEVGGSENGDEITATATVYSTPDSYGNFATVTTTTTDEDPGSPFSSKQWQASTQTQVSPDTSSWCIGLPESVAVTRTAYDEPAVTRTSTYTNDYVNCRPTSEVQDAGKPAYDVTQSFSYDSFGNLSQKTVTGAGMTARVSTYNWGATGQFEQQVQDPVAYGSGYHEQIGYNYGLGLKTSDVIESTGGTQDTPPTQWVYDPLGELTKETLADGTSLNWTYTACNESSTCYGAFETITQTEEGTTGAEITDRSTYVDSLQRPIAATSRLMDGTYTLTETSYDQFGNVAKQSAPCSAVGCALYWTDTSYDALNRPLNILSPDPSNPTVQDLTVIAYEGRQITTTNPNKQTMTRITDVTGAVRETRDANAYGQNFTVDSDGNVLGVTDTQGNSLYSHTYVYGGAGDYIVSLTDRALGAWTYSPDALGEVTSYEDSKGNVFHLTYDALGRPSTRDDGWTSSGSETVTQWTWGSTPANHDVGQLDEAQTVTTDGTYVEQDGYDADGRVAYRDVTIPGDTTYDYTYTFNAQTGELSQLKYPANGSSYSLAVNYSYGYGILSAVTDAGNGTVYWQANTVNPLGEVTEDTLGGAIVSQQTFTPVGGWLTKSITGPTAGSAAIQNQTYSHDPLGNVIQRQDDNLGLTESFWYDPDNRLQYSTLNNGNTTTTNLQLSYNLDGGISQKLETGGTDTPSSYSVAWTSYNYPKSIDATLSSGASETATFDYGPNRLRWRMVYTEGSASETTEYIGNLMEKVSSAAIGSDYKYYIEGSNGLAAIVSVEGGIATLHYVLEDQEGSISGLLTASGGVLEAEDFTAYGNRRNAATWSGAPSSTDEGVMDGITRQGFTGQTVLGQMGLNHMNGRVEDAVTGTFLSPDPNIVDPYSTQNYNRYSYVANDPLTLVDPSGFSWLSVLLNPFSSDNPLNPFSKKNPLNPLSNDNPLNPFGTVGSFLLWRHFDFEYDTSNHVLAENRWLQPIAEIAACYWGGPYGCAAANAYLTRLDGGSMDQALLAGALSYASYQLNGEVDQYESDLGKLGTAAGRGLIAGGISSAEGGSFAKSFELAAGFQLADDAYEDYTHHAAGWAGGDVMQSGIPCGGQGSNCYIPDADGSVPQSYWNIDTFGLNQELPLSGGCWYQSGACSAFLDQVPGLQAVSQLHDSWMNVLSWKWNFPAMLPAAAITYGALLNTPYAVSALRLGR